MTVTTTVLPASRPRAGQVGGEQGQELVAGGQRPGVVDGHQPVGVAVEGEPEVRSASRRTSAARRSGWVEPHAVVDVGAVGLGPDHLHRAPQACETRPGRLAEAAPLAQSSDHVHAVEGARLEQPDEMVDVAVGATLGLGPQPAHAVARSAERARRPRRPGPCRAPPRSPPRRRRGA